MREYEGGETPAYDPAQWQEWAPALLRRRYRQRLRRTSERLPARVAIEFQHGLHGWGWYRPIERQDGVWYRWGAQRAGLEVRVDTSLPLRLRMELSTIWGAEGAAALEVRANDCMLRGTLAPLSLGWVQWEAHLPAEALAQADGLLSLSFFAPHAARPQDALTGAVDERMIGCGIAQLEIAPLDAGFPAVVQRREAIPRPVVFLHIAKSGGVTLRHMLSVGFDAGRTYTLHVRHPEEEEHFSASPETLDACDLIQGHFRHGLMVPRLNDPTVVTLLRDPVARCLSLFHFWQENAQAGKLATPELNAIMRDISLEEFLERDEPPIVEQRDNHQTRVLAAPHLWYQGAVADLLPLAQERLEQMACFGLVERMRESTLMLCEALGMEAPEDEQRLNQSRTRTAKEQLPAQTRGRLEERNAVDIALYNYARELFEQRWRAFLDRLPANHY